MEIIDFKIGGLVIFQMYKNTTIKPPLELDVIKTKKGILYKPKTITKEETKDLIQIAKEIYNRHKNDIEN